MRKGIGRGHTGWWMSLKLWMEWRFHAYLHRKEGEAWNADYWYKRAGRRFHRATLEEEWAALVDGLAG